VPKAVSAAAENYNPRAAAMPKKGGRNYDDFAAGASGAAPAVPAPRAVKAAPTNPCSVGQRVKAVIEKSDQWGRLPH